MYCNSICSKHIEDSLVYKYMHEVFLHGNVFIFFSQLTYEDDENDGPCITILFPDHKTPVHLPVSKVTKIGPHIINMLIPHSLHNKLGFRFWDFWFVFFFGDSDHNDRDGDDDGNQDDEGDDDGDDDDDDDVEKDYYDNDMLMRMMIMMIIMITTTFMLIMMVLMILILMMMMTHAITSFKPNGIIGITHNFWQPCMNYIL